MKVHFNITDTEELSKSYLNKIKLTDDISVFNSFCKGYKASIIQFKFIRYFYLFLIVCFI